MELEVGAVIERYEVVRFLGQGGMAAVYLVQHRTLGTRHALKVLTVSNSVIRDRLIDEGRLQANLKHPNMVAVADVLDVAGAPGLLMEYVDGPSLDVWLSENRPPLDQAEALFQGVLSAVRRAHDADVIHRDLKPGNVLLAPSDEGGVVVKVADFGLAKALGGEARDLRRTRTGVAMGTPAYMAPEQFRDSKHVDRRADVFALGAILYELVCGRHPFPGDDLLQLFNAIASNVYVPPRELVPDLPRRVEAAIVGCLAADRNQRIPDCHTLGDVLAGRRLWQEDPGVSEGPAPTFNAAPAPPSGQDDVEATFAMTGGLEPAASVASAPRVPSPPVVPSTPGFDPAAPSSVGGGQEEPGVSEGPAPTFNAAPAPPSGQDDVEATFAMTGGLEPAAPVASAPRVSSPPADPSPRVFDPAAPSSVGGGLVDVRVDRSETVPAPVKWWRWGAVFAMLLVLLTGVSIVGGFVALKAYRAAAEQDRLTEAEAPATVEPEEATVAELPAEPDLSAQADPEQVTESDATPAPSASPATEPEPTPTLSADRATPSPARSTPAAVERSVDPSIAAEPGSPAVAESVPVVVLVEEPVAIRQPEVSTGSGEPSGTLYVRSQPGPGQVVIDGAKRGRTRWRGDLSPGEHKVTVRGDDGASAKATAVIRSGKDTYICLDLDHGGVCQ